MNSSLHQVPFSKLVAIALLLSACMLGGCGRKGPLDLPPAAANAPIAPASADADTGSAYRTQNGSSTNAADPGLFGNANSAVVAPRGQNKRILLDPILD